MCVVESAFNNCLNLKKRKKKRKKKKKKKNDLRFIILRALVVLVTQRACVFYARFLPRTLRSSFQDIPCFPCYYDNVLSGVFFLSISSQM